MLAPCVRDDCFSPLLPMQLNICFVFACTLLLPLLGLGLFSLSVRFSFKNEHPGSQNGKPGQRQTPSYRLADSLVPLPITPDNNQLSSLHHFFRWTSLPRSWTCTDTSPLPFQRPRSRRIVVLTCFIYQARQWKLWQVRRKKAKENEGITGERTEGYKADKDFTEPWKQSATTDEAGGEAVKKVTRSQHREYQKGENFLWVRTKAGGRVRVPGVGPRREASAQFDDPVLAGRPCWLVTRG